MTDPTLKPSVSNTSRSFSRRRLFCFWCKFAWCGLLSLASAQTDTTTDEGVPVRRPEIVDPQPERPAVGRTEAPDIVRSQQEGGDDQNEIDPVNAVPPKTADETPDDPEEAKAEEPAKPDPPKREPGDDLFDYAGVLYGKKFYDLAGEKYQTYLATYRKGRHAEAALYRSAECSLKRNLKEAALRDYKRLIRDFQRGSYVAPAAYRIASLGYNDQRYGYAAPYFRIAASNAEQHKLKVASLYYRARCLQLDSQVKAAREGYEEVIEVANDNAFWHKALLALGRMEAAASKKPQALAWFSKLAEEPELEEIVGAVTSGGVRNPKWTSEQQDDLIEALGEATVKAGLLYSEEGQIEKAIKLYNRMLKFNRAADWKALARYGLIRLHYDAEQYEEVIEAFKATTSVTLPDATRPKMLIMVAKSYHELEQYSNAFDSYRLIEQAFPDSVEAVEAGYQKLRCQFVLGDPSPAGIRRSLY